MISSSKHVFYLYGWLYDKSIEFLLRSTRNRVARYILEYNLFPALDICCGTGRQCSLICGNQQFTIGLDLDLKMMRYAASKYPYIPFICADASNIPIKEKYFKGIIISYSLHDKPPELRSKMIQEARRLLVPEGKIILVDFEKPWNRLSRLGEFLALLVERMAGGEHFRNGRQFLQQGGLREFMKQQELHEMGRHHVQMASSGIVVAKFATFAS